MCTHIACLRLCIVKLAAFVWLFSTVCFQMSPKTACLRRCIVTLAAFVCLFPLLVLEWVLKLPVWEYAKSHWLHLFDFFFFFHYVFTNEPSNQLFQKMHIQRLHFYFLCFLKRFFNVFWNCLKMQSHTDCFCLTFLQCVFSNESSNRQVGKTNCHSDCICLTFLHCVFSNGWMKTGDLRRCIFTLVAFVWLFFTMCF